MIFHTPPVVGLHEDPGRIKWYINGEEEESARDLHTWNKTMINGIYQIEMKVRFANDEVVSITSPLKIFAGSIKIKNYRH